MADDLSQAKSAPHTPPEKEPQLAEFVKEAEKQELRIDGLISRPEDARNQAIWSDEIDDPESQKNLRTFKRLITEAIGLCERLRRRPRPLRRASWSRIEELRRRIVLPEDKPLTLPLLLDHRFALERLLVDLGDKTYLRTRAAELHEEREGTVVTWAGMYPNTTPPLFVTGGKAAEGNKAADGGKRLEPTAVESTRAMLRQLLAAKEEVDRPIRARREMKRRMLLYRVVPVLALSAAIFGYAIACVGKLEPGMLPLAVTAAMTGAVLGQLMKLRDEVTRGAQVRDFFPLFVAQVAVGLVTGLFVSVAAKQLGILNVNDSKQLATLSFVAGFSEAAFLGLVTKIAGDSKPKAPAMADRPAAGK